ncbi:MAG: hypothetical protein GX542_01370 [Rhodococcus sp.]|nr:hypothetical protein [Rhodococcus sp. (in: high G+C Gram-positive bacteria)]
MYNYDIQNLIVGFVDSQKPYFEYQHELYYISLYNFVDFASSIATMLGYPPVP